jgi:hypothetical protein
MGKNHKKTLDGFFVDNPSYKWMMKWGTLWQINSWTLKITMF